MTQTPSRRLFVALSILTLLVAAWLRFYRLGELPLGLHYDEAANVILAGEIARGVSTPIFLSSYTGKEALFFYWAALWMKLLGVTPLALRISAAMIGLATIAATIWAIRELARGRHNARWTALLTAAFLAASFWHLVFSRYGFRAITQPLLQALTIAALWRGWGLSPSRRTGEWLWPAIAGLFCGLTAHTYLAARAFPIPLAAAWIVLLVADRGKRRLRLIQLAVFAATAALALSPLAYYWWTHPGTFLNRTQQVAAASWAEAWAGIRACLGMFFLRGDPYIRFNLPGRPLFDPITAALFLLGVASALITRGQRQKNSCVGPAALAARVFLLTHLVAMLMPSALATGDITPSNLRAIGLLPFVYMFPALGLLTAIGWVEQAIKSNRRLGRVRVSIAASRRPWIAAALFTALLAYLAPTAADAYFREWASSPALYAAADGDMVDAARYLNQANVDNMTLYVASTHYRHPTLALLARSYDRIRWLTGGRTLVFPAQGEALLILPRSASENLAWIEAALPADALIAAPSGPDGAPALRAYRFASVEPQPQRRVTADFGHIVQLLGYDVVGEPHSGATAEIVVWWRVLNIPTPADYAPSARIADPWGFAWGETLPFHYPAEQWTPGEVVADLLAIPIAPGAPPGDYGARFGFYSPAADARLPVLDEAGRYAGDAVWLPIRLERASAPPDVASLGIRQLLDLRAGDLTLLGFNLDAARLRPGEPLYLTLFWRAEAPLPETTVTLRLGETTLYAGAPVHGCYPTSAWNAGEIVTDRYNPRLPRAMPPGDATLRLDVDGLEATLGIVAVQPIARTFDVPPISHPLNASLGGRIALLGYDLSAETVAAGDQLVLTLYWQALTEMDEDYTVFTHLLAPDGAMAGQQDSSPVNGTYPTSLWLPGEVVADSHVIAVRLDAAGPHWLEVGLYLVENGMRLPVGDSDALILQTVAVTNP